MLPVPLRLKKNPKPQTNEIISAEPQEMMARKQYLQGQNQGKEWQGERVRSITRALLLGVLTHKQVAWGCRGAFWGWAGTAGTFGGTWSPLIHPCSAAELRTRI